MKTLFYLLAVLGASALVASSAIAAEFARHDGVKVTVQYDPLGPNNSIVAYVKFVNENQYRVEVNWQPVITCQDENKREGSVAGFSMNEGETYVVNIWRSAACGQGQIKDLSVKIDVIKANP